MGEIKSREILIARYNEDLSWTSEIPRPWAVTVYNKCADCAWASTPLENTGREAGTYLHHIVSAYDHLADITAFVQGDPFFGSSLF